MKSLRAFGGDGLTIISKVWPRKLLLVFAGLLLILSSSCNKDSTNQPPWKTPYELWQLRNPHGYTIDQRRSCFCPYSGILVRVWVVADTVFRVTTIPDTAIVSYPFYRSVDSLFSLIRNSTNDSLVIRCNADYGYPEYLDVNPQSHPVDGGFTYENSNLQPMGLRVTKR